MLPVNNYVLQLILIWQVLLETIKALSSKLYPVLVSIAEKITQMLFVLSFFIYNEGNVTPRVFFLRTE